MNWRRIVLLVSFPIFLVLLSYQVILFFLPLTEAQENTLSYVQENQPLLLNFTPSEIQHLQDVRMVMAYADGVFYLLLILISALLLMEYKRKGDVKKCLKYAGVITTLSMVILGVLAVFFFNELFTLFHLLFFPQGNWIFASDSRLIQAFPAEFFVKIGLGIFLFTFLEGVVVLGTALRWRK